MAPWPFNDHQRCGTSSATYSSTGTMESKQELYKPLIPGLPDDIVTHCLSMIPRRYHDTLRCVSRRWRDLLCNETWHSCRQINNLEETWIYVKCEDRFTRYHYYVLDPNPNPTKRCWRVLRSAPRQCLKKDGMSFEAIGNKLYILGGCTMQKDATHEVYCYDAPRNKWEMAPPMPTARCYFSSTVVDNKLYVAGGFGMNSVNPKSLDIYDSFSNSWSSQDYPRDIPGALFKLVNFNGKLHFIHKTFDDNYHVGVFDPTSGTWERPESKESRFELCCRGPTVEVDGDLYMLDQTLGTRLMMWEEESNRWVVLGRLSNELTRPPCQLTAIGRSIFMVGEGLNILVIDMNQATRPGGFLVSSSFVPAIFGDLKVLSCKSITI